MEFAILFIFVALRAPLCFGDSLSRDSLIATDIDVLVSFISSLESGGGVGVGARIGDKYQIRLTRPILQLLAK